MMLLLQHRQYKKNKPENKFCSKCKFVLSFNAFNEAIQGNAIALKDAEKVKQEPTAMKVDTEQLESLLENTSDQITQCPSY
jgi:hypothetical protein